MSYFEHSSKALLWQKPSKSEHKNTTKPSKPTNPPTSAPTPTDPTTTTPTPTPTPTSTPSTNAYDLQQGGCAYIDTSGLPANGHTQLVFPYCTTVTLYEAFNSDAAKAVWNANQGSNPLFAPTPPTDPANSSLMVIATATGEVEVMSPFNKGLQMEISNTAITGGSEYVISAKNNSNQANPMIYMILNSPDTSVSIPANISAGAAEACATYANNQQSVASAAYGADFIGTESGKYKTLKPKNFK